jgi:hypothetical protein
LLLNLYRCRDDTSSRPRTIGRGLTGEIATTYDHLSPLAQRIGRWLAEQCVDGMPGHFGDGLLTAFADDERADIRLALSELKADGLVELSPLIGPKLPRIRTTYALFEAADPGITGHDPGQDAVVLARLLIEDPKLGNVPQLESAAGWESRRFNPALGLLVPLFPPGRRRSPIQNRYPVLGFIVGPDEILELKRFIQTSTR